MGNEYENTDGEMIAKERNMSASEVMRCMMSLCEEFPEKLWNTMDTNQDGVVHKEKFINTMNLNADAYQKWIYKPVTEILKATEQFNNDHM